MNLDYVAGFFDGEGSISVVCSRTPGEKVKRGIPGKVYLKYTLLVQITNTKRLLLDEVCQRWGGKVYLQTAHKRTPRLSCYVWRINGKYAAPFLTEIRPYLRLKGEQAALALEFLAIPPGWNPKLRLEIREKIVALNDSPRRVSRYEESINGVSKITPGRS